MELVHVSQKDRVATLTIDRQQALNALNQDVLIELHTKILELEGAQVVIFTGAGEKAFVAGADIAAMKGMSALKARAFAELGQNVIRLIEEAPFISIAMVNGFALGGGLELALACDLIYASDNAKLGAPETNLGIIPGFGGTANITRRIGFHRSMDLILTGRMITAEVAKAWGLVLEVYSPKDLKTKVEETANLLAAKGTHSLLAARRLVRGVAQDDQERALLLERETFAGLFASGEPQEGMTAFLEKRAARFHK